MSNWLKRHTRSKHDRYIPKVQKAPFYSSKKLPKGTDNIQRNTNTLPNENNVCNTI